MALAQSLRYNNKWRVAWLNINHRDSRLSAQKNETMLCNANNIYRALGNLTR